MKKNRISRRAFLKGSAAATAGAALASIVPTALRGNRQVLAAPSSEPLIRPQVADVDTWFLPFADNEGRPWGKGTNVASRSASGKPPWDVGCTVTPLIGGYEAMTAMRKCLEAALAEAKKGGDFGKKGFVYISDWRFSPLRDISDENRNWTWDHTSGTETDPTILGMLLKLMQAGIQLRALFWLPPPLTGLIPFIGLESHIAEHYWMAEIVQRENKRLVDKNNLTSPIAIVGLDMRLPRIPYQAASHHQKMMVVRAGQVQVAFCGGVDLTFTRRDAPDNPKFPYDPSHPHLYDSQHPRFLAGDWQSGELIPSPEHIWPREDGVDYTSVDASHRPDVKASSDLPVEIYGQYNEVWHDQHLKLEGPIVDTLTAQFTERWSDVSEYHDISVWADKQIYSLGQVFFSTAEAFNSNGIIPLPMPTPIAPLPTGTSKVQMWRTLPLRVARSKDSVLAEGEFTVMAGVAKACKAAKELIWIFDQYFWSRSIARLLNAQIRQKPTLHIVIILPPHADSQAIVAHHARRLAIETLLQGLTSSESARIGVYNLWETVRKIGIYVHTKVQIYDANLLVCGSANLNRRSFTCDGELDCAVLDPQLVTNHQQRLWELLFTDTSPWPLPPNENLNKIGNGRVFFVAFKQAAPFPNDVQGGGPKSGVYLTQDVWRGNQQRILPTVPVSTLEEDPFAPKFKEMYRHLLDPMSLAKEPEDKSLAEWSDLIESPTSRITWRKPAG